jgi:hypothetical protein
MICTQTVVDGCQHVVVLLDVYYAPELAKNLVSTARIARSRCLICIDAMGCCMTN